MAKHSRREDHELLGQLKCGCAITTDGEDLHSWPCCPEHDEQLSRVSEEIARENGIPVQEVRDL